MRPWLLEESNYATWKGTSPPEVAVLPLGATEPHNLHLPYGTDTCQVGTIAERACGLAWEKGARAVALPPLPYGTETNLGRFPLAMNLQPSTIARIIADLTETLASSGVRKLLLLNGHGGNDLKWVLRELYGKTPVQLFLCNWYAVAQDRALEVFQHRDDHAGEMETSVMLSLRPDLVSLDQADAGATRPSRFEAVRKGWVQITRPWHILTTNSGSGNPVASTAAKGEQFLQIVVGRIADFLVELARSPIDETFPL